jgi:hypothetical protein
MGLRGVPQEGAALRKLLLPHPVGQEAEVTQPVEAARRDVEHQTPQEFHGRERQGTQAAAALVGLVAEGHLAALQGDEPMVRDGAAMRLARQGGEDGLGLLEGLFGVDHPLPGAPRREEPLPGWGLGKCPTTTHEGQLVLAIELHKACEVEAPEATREDTNGQAEVGTTWHPPCPLRRYPSGGQDTMEMGMVLQLLAPGVEHSEAPELRAEMFRVLGDIVEALCNRVKEQAIELAGVRQRQGPQGVRQGKDDMDVGRVEHLALPGGEPRGLGRPRAFGATAVPARVVRLDFVSTGVALRDMAPEGGSSAQTDGPQRPVLLAREGRPIACQKSGAMLAHHISHFQWRPTHGSLSRSAGHARASKGLSVAWSAGGATWR